MATRDGGDRATFDRDNERDDDWSRSTALLRDRHHDAPGLGRGPVTRRHSRSRRKWRTAVSRTGRRPRYLRGLRARPDRDTRCADRGSGLRHRSMGGRVRKCNAFLAKLVRRGFAIATDCIHNRAPLYHVHSKLLHHAIGEPDSRYRRTIARFAGERLMRLDAAQISSDLEWLTTRSEKLAYLESRTASHARDRRGDTPAAEPANVANQFPGTFPIGIDRSGRTLLLYLATKPWPDELRAFLVGHAALLSVTPRGRSGSCSPLRCGEWSPPTRRPLRGTGESPRGGHDPRTPARKIRSRAKAGTPQHELARVFNISRPLCCAVCHPNGLFGRGSFPQAGKH